MSSETASQRHRLVLFVLFLFSLLPFKIRYALSHYVHVPDAYYYLDIAENLRDGLGFVTDMSMLHHGMVSLPAPSTVYPLWPRLLGTLSQGIPLDLLALWLPPIFFFLTLILAYRFGQQLVPGSLWKVGPVDLGAGHLFALIYGLHPRFFATTSQPLTEGITYTLFFLTLMAAHRFAKTPGPLKGMAFGAALALLFLARSQMLVIVLATFIALFWAAAMALIHKDKMRLPMLLGGMGTTLAFGAILSIHLVFLGSFVADVSLTTLLRFDQYQASEFLSKVPDSLVRDGGFFGILLDRLRGFGIAFSFEGSNAYARAFHLFHYALIGSIVAAVVAFLKGWRPPFRRLFQSDSFYPVFLTTMSLAGFLSIHYLHKNAFSEWHFAMRHALTAAPLFVFALIALLKQGKVFKTATLLLILGSVILGYQSLNSLNRGHARYQTRFEAGYMPEMVQWLNQVENGDKKVVFAMYQGQKLSYFAKKSAFHWVYKGTSLKDLQNLVAHLGVEYLLLTPRERKKRAFPFLEDANAFDQLFERHKRNISGYDIYRRR